MSVGDSIKERLVHGLKVTFVSRLVFILANAGLIVALTRYLLTPRGYGELSFALSVLGIMHLLVGIGIAKSGARYVTEYLETEPEQVARVIRSTAQFLLGAAVLNAVLLWAFRDHLARLLGESSLEPFLLVGVGYLALYPFAVSVRILFNAFNRLTWSAILRAIDGVSRLAFAVVFVLLGFGAVGALLGYVAGFLVATVVGVGAFYVHIYRELSAPTSAAAGVRRRILRYAVPLTVTSGADVLDQKVDAVLVGVLLNPTAVGFYMLARQVSEFATAPAWSIDTTMAPRLGERKASENLRSGARIYETALEHVLLLYVPAGVGLILVAEPTIRYIFGTGYLGAVDVMRVFGVFLVVHAVNQITTNSLDYLGRGRERAIANGATSIANFGLNLLLIPAIGVVGAAVATVITHGAYAAANVYYLSQELPIRLGRILGETVRITAVAGVMGAVVFAALPYVASLPSLLAVVLLGVGAWAALSVISGALDPQIIRDIVA